MAGLLSGFSSGRFRIAGTFAIVKEIRDGPELTKRAGATKLRPNQAREPALPARGLARREARSALRRKET
jgi:hypothetical protein